MSDDVFDLKKPRRKSSATASAPIANRRPPYSTESEQGVLGCIMLSPQDCLEECAEAGVRVEWFYDLRHQTIFTCFTNLYREKKQIDLIVLQNELKRMEQLDAVGGLMYLSTLPDAVPSAANLSYYIEIVREKFQLRSIANLCTAVAGRVFDSPTADPVELLSMLELDFARIAEGEAVQESPSINALVNDAIDMIEKMLAKGGVTGLPSGFIDLDRMTGGLHDGEVVIIAARPSAGKSALGMQICESLACDSNIPTAFISVEMDPRQLVLRAVGARARVNIRGMTSGKYQQAQDGPALVAATGKIAKAPLFIEDAAGWTAGQIRARCRRLVAKHGVKLVVVDYLQLISPTVITDNRERDVASISNELKTMARELKIPVIVLCQMNRNIESAKGRRPMLSDLRESGAIEQDGDMIGFLCPLPQQEGHPEDVAQTKLIIAKQRNGPIGDVDLTFLKAYTRFESAAKVSVDDVPGRDE